MYCYKCGKENPDIGSFCIGCGESLIRSSFDKNVCGGDNCNHENNDPAFFKAPVVVEQELTSGVNSAPVSAKGKTNYNNIKTAFYVVAAAIMVIGFIIFCVIATQGSSIGTIESVGGRTLEEAYYQGVGHIYTSFGWFVLCASSFFSMVLIYLGIKIGRFEES